MLDFAGSWKRFTTSTFTLQISQETGHMKKVLFVAQDAAPSRAFQRFAPALTEAGFGVELIVADGKTFPTIDGGMSRKVGSADLLVIGMSSRPEYATDELFAAKQAIKSGVPLACYGDVPGCHVRHAFWGNDISRELSLYLGYNQAEEDGVRKSFPNARFRAIGNPLREEMAFARYTREEVRLRLGVTPDDKVILVGGGKSPYSNMVRIGLVLETMNMLDEFRKTPIKVLLSLHPGDKAPVSNYDEIVKESPVPFRIAESIKGKFETSDMIGGADLVFCGLTGSTAIEAAYKRIPVIQTGGEIELVKLFKETGSRTPEAVAVGASLFCNGGNCGLDLVRAMDLIWGTGVGASLMNDQASAYPIPQRVGQATENAVNVIREFLEVPAMA